MSLAKSVLVCGLIVIASFFWQQYLRAQQQSLVEQYLNLSQSLILPTSAASAQTEFANIYNKLSQQSRVKLATALIEQQWLMQEKIDQLIAYYPKLLVTELAANNHLKSMRYLASKTTSDNNIWHTKLFALDYQYVWQYAQMLATTASNSTQHNEVLATFQKALALLDNTSGTEVKTAVTDKIELQNQIVRYAIVNRHPQWRQLLSLYQTPATKMWLTSYQQYYLDEHSWLEFLQSKSAPHSCEKPLTLVANNPWDIQALVNLTQQLLKSQLGDGFCIQNIIWLDSSQAIEAQLYDIPARYWLIMRPVDKAYRLNRQIHLPATAGFKLLQHEVAHWLGFEDEYALRQALADIRCASPEFGQTIWSMGVNVVAVKDETFFTSLGEAYNLLSRHMTWLPHISDFAKFFVKHPQGWKLKTTFDTLPQSMRVGIYPTNTCDNYTGVTAYKPLVELSFMYNYELDIPKFYKKHMLGDG